MKTNKNSLIFASTSKIASWIIKELSELNYNIFKVDRKPYKGSQFSADVRNYNNVLKTYEALYAQCKKLDSIYYCAGSYNPSLIYESNPQRWKDCLDVNCLGAYNIFRAFCEVYGTKDNIKMVYLGSTAVISKPKLNSSYSVSKVGLEMLVNYINNETPTNIRSCTLRLGRCKTTFSGLGLEKNDKVVDEMDIRNIIKMLENSSINTFPDLISSRPIFN